MFVNMFVSNKSDRQWPDVNKATLMLLICHSKLPQLFSLYSTAVQQGLQQCLDYAVIINYDIYLIKSTTFIFR